MSDYNSYPTLLQSSHTEYITSQDMDTNGNQMSNNSNNNIIYNSTPLIVLNSQKSDMALIQNSMLNDGQAYVTIQTQPSVGGTDLSGSKMVNSHPLIIQAAQNMPLQTSQYQQQPAQSTTISVQQNVPQMTSLTPSQLQSLSYLMQTQMAPQFIQTQNGLIQIVPQNFITTQQQVQGQDQITNLPTIGWSLGNFNGTGNSLTLDGQLQSVQMSNIGLQQLIPLQQIIQSNNGNSFFTNQNEASNQMVSSIVDLNNSNNGTKKSPNDTKKTSRRKRKQTTKLSSDWTHPHTASAPLLAHPTSTNDVMKEMADCSSGTITRLSDPPTASGADAGPQYDNKGRPFSFLCTDCPKKFTLNSRLNAHMRCHTGMRPFTCTVCGFSFTQRSYLIRHAAVHKEERPFCCELCLKCYKHYGSLANHRKLHRKDQTEVCVGVMKMESVDDGGCCFDGETAVLRCGDDGGDGGGDGVTADDGGDGGITSTVAGGEGGYGLPMDAAEASYSAVLPPEYRYD